MRTSSHFPPFLFFIIVKMSVVHLSAAESENAVSLKAISDVVGSIDEFNIFQYIAGLSRDEFRCRGIPLTDNVKRIRKGIKKCQKDDGCSLGCALCILDQLGLIKRPESKSGSVVQLNELDDFLSDTIPDKFLKPFRKGIKMCTAKFVPKKDSKGCEKLKQLLHCVQAISVLVCKIDYKEAAEGNRELDWWDGVDECEEFDSWISYK